MGDIIYTDFSENNPEVIKNRLDSFRQTLTDILLDKQERVRFEQEKPVIDQNPDNLKKWRDELDRINEWLVNLNTRDVESVQDFIDSIDNPIE